MTTDQAIVKLERAVEKGLAVVAEQAKTEITPFITIFSGELRDSVEINPIGKTSIEIKMGKLDYAGIQHEGNLGHLGSRGNYKSLKKFSPDYPTAYRKAKASKVLRKSRPRWFSVLNDKSVLLKLTKILANAVRKNLV